MGAGVEVHTLVMLDKQKLDAMQNARVGRVFKILHAGVEQFALPFATRLNLVLSIGRERCEESRRFLSDTARLGGADPDRGVLAVELAAAGRNDAQLVFIFPALARLCFGRRCACSVAQRHVHPESFAARFHLALRHLGARVVAL